MRNLYFLSSFLIIFFQSQAQSDGLMINEPAAVFLMAENSGSEVEKLSAGNITGTGKIVSSPTDYFRSVGNGAWKNAATWQSSFDNISWVSATIWPTNLAKTIYIRSGYSVDIGDDIDLDELVIQSGGILNLTFGLVQVFDNVLVDDIIIESGGVFNLADIGNPPVFMSPMATARISTGGILRVSATGLTATNVGVNLPNFVYEHASVLELNSAMITSNNVVFFPNVNVATVPIFRTTIPLNIGNVNTVTFNGLFEAAGGTVTFVNTGTKTFRNGITGTGNIIGTTSGKFIINGATASMGGTGSLILPALGVDISNNTTVTMISAKTVAGTINLLTNSFIKMANSNLTLTGNISGASLTSHIVTDGTGKLVFTGIGAGTVMFPVGATTATYNPVSIANGGGLSYGVRVLIGISAPVYSMNLAVNRTWFITPIGGTPGTINTSFYYNTGEGNASFNYGDVLQLGHYTGVWNVIQNSLAATGTGAYQVATIISTLGNNLEAPLVLGNLGAILASNGTVSVDYFNGIKQQANHILNWKLTCTGMPWVNLFLERSMDGRNFSSIHAEYATAVRCQQPFGFTDNQPGPGINYYRIKMIDADGKVSFSQVLLLLNAKKGLEILNISPNPVTGDLFYLRASAANTQKLLYSISDQQGRVLLKNTLNLLAGYNAIPVDVSNLPAGNYQVLITDAGGQNKLLKLVLQ